MSAAIVASRPSTARWRRRSAPGKLGRPSLVRGQRSRSRTPIGVARNPCVDCTAVPLWRCEQCPVGRARAQRRGPVAGRIHAREVLSLTWIIFAIAAVVFLVVTGLLVYSAVRFRAGADAPTPEQTAGNVPIEVVWTVTPALVLVVVLVFTERTIREVIRPAASAPS